MASGTATPRVRLVRCPTCRLVLPEVEDVPVYKCGGCDTILVAKNRKVNVEGTSFSHEIEASDLDKPLHVSENGESTSSTPQEVHLSQVSDSQSGKLDENLSIGGHYSDRNTFNDADYKCEKHDENGSNEGQQDGSRQLQLDSSEHCNVRQKGVPIEDFLPTKLHHENEELLLVAEANEKTSWLEGACSELVINNKIDSNIRSPSLDNPYAERESSLTITASAAAAAGEVLSSDELFSSPNDHMEQPQRSEPQGFDHVRSTDSFEAEDFVSPGSEFSDPDLEHLSKSVTTKTSHAHDGSISSYDGMDDQFPDQQLHSSENNYKDAYYLIPEERRKKDKLPAKGLINGNARNQSKPYGTAKYSKWHRDETLEPVRQRHTPTNWTKLVRDEYPSRIPFSQRASLHEYENAAPSRELNDEFPEYHEQESMKLLRMVHELEDQIIKRCNLNRRKSKGRASIPWRKKHFPAYYYPEEEVFYPSHDTDNSCLRCHRSPAWPRSEQLPTPVFQHKRGFRSAQSGQCCYNCHSYCLSSPQRYMEPDFSSWSHEIISGDKRYRYHELKRYSKEKHYSVRRHRQPVASGAPFVTCYHCFSPLELPADYLLSRRRFHQLRCGACLEVLTFALQNGNRIVPYEHVARRTSTNCQNQDIDTNGR